MLSDICSSFVNIVRYQGQVAVGGAAFDSHSLCPVFAF